MRLFSVFSRVLKPAASSSRPRITVTVLPPRPPRVGCTRTTCWLFGVEVFAGLGARARLSALLNSCQPPFGIFEIPTLPILPFPGSAPDRPTARHPRHGLIACLR